MWQSDRQISQKEFYIFVSSNLDVWPLDLRFAPLIAVVQRYVSTKLEVSTASLFRESQKHGTDRQTTDGRGATLNAVR